MDAMRVCTEGLLQGKRARLEASGESWWVNPRHLRHRGVMSFQDSTRGFLGALGLTPPARHVDSLLTDYEGRVVRGPVAASAEVQ